MPRDKILCVTLVAACLATGCQSDPSKAGGYEWADFAPEKIIDNTKRSIYGKKDEAVARKAYADGEELFRKKEYEAAREQFETAAFRWPDSQLEEDAMFMMGECGFFSDRYADADKDYDKLIKKYTTTEHIGTISRRSFAMGRYWQDKHEKEPHWPVTPNFTDKERPMFDTAGRALKSYERIVQTDPRGPLADDAIMAVADAMFNKRYYDDADFRYKMLITDYPQSKYQYDAHERSLRCKLLKYQGPEYDDTPLKEAEVLVDQMLTQFPDRVGADREKLVKYKAEVMARKQMCDMHAAEYYAKGGYNYAARQYYEKVARNYPKSNLSEQALAKMDEMKGLPDRPDPPLEWAYNWMPGMTKPAETDAPPPQMASQPDGTLRR
jgi:outer membrane protein assembly factor BamD (BamD/ComL family)